MLVFLIVFEFLNQEHLKCDSATVFDLAAYVLQESCGSYTELVNAITHSLSFLVTFLCN